MGRARGTAHCALCDLTHGRVREKPEWRALQGRLGVKVEVVHRNERDEHLRAVEGLRLPCIVAVAGDDVRVLLGPDELEACGGDLAELEQRLQVALADPR